MSGVLVCPPKNAHNLNKCPGSSIAVEIISVICLQVDVYVYMHEDGILPWKLYAGQNGIITRNKELDHGNMF